jgi:hypothetical protein
MMSILPIAIINTDMVFDDVEVAAQISGKFTASYTVEQSSSVWKATECLWMAVTATVPTQCEVLVTRVAEVKPVSWKIKKKLNLDQPII